MSVPPLPQGFLCETHTARESRMRAIARRVSLFLTTLRALVAIAGRSAAAQADGSGEGSIRGRVVSRVDERPIPDAHVFVAGTSRSATTNQSGEYVVSDVPAGTYQVRARLIGYGERSDTVTVTAGAVATADFSLEAKALLLDVKAVTALGIEQKVEPQAAHLLRRDARRAQRRPYGIAHCLPDVLGGLFDVFGVGPPHLDGPRGGGEQTAVGGQDSGAGAAGADIDAEIDRGV